MPFDPARLSLFPDKPGVYLMKDVQGEILYVGKAKSLKKRLRHYFEKGRDARLMVPYLVAKIEEIDVIVVSSEKEAFLLENNLIKRHQPHYNALLKDDKSYIALKISHRDQWPAVKIVRHRGESESDALYFGPYVSAQAARQTLDLLRSLFPLRQCSDQEFARRTRPCLLYQMKRCIAPCVRKCTEEEYRHHVNRTIQFLRGQDREVVEDLYKEMRAASESLEFEKAHSLLKTIRQIEETLEKQHVDRPLRLNIDAIGIHRHGEEVLLVHLVFRGGRLIGSRRFDFSGIAEDDSALLASFLLQYYDGRRESPQELLLPCHLEGQASIEEILSSREGRKVLLRVPRRGDKKTVLDMAKVNAEALFKSGKSEEDLREKTLLEMQESLGLSRYPYRIECVDHSHFAGAEPAVSVAVFIGGRKEGRQSRTYSFRGRSADDYAAMREVLRRRYKRSKEKNCLPDLLVVDGGKGHLQVALSVFEELNVVGVEVMGLAKDRGNHGKGMTQERLFLPGRAEPLLLDKHSPLLFFLQRVRDEAHRMAISLHRTRRSKKFTFSSHEHLTQ